MQLIMRKVCLVLCGFYYAFLSSFSLATPLNQAETVKSQSVADIKALQLRLSEFEYFSAEFEQQLRNAKGEVLQQQRGKLALHKPNLLNWQAQAPYTQQVVVDGLQVWLYDPDLEQVTVKPLGNDISQTPALILAGDIEQISQLYQIKQVKQGEFVLTPKQDNPLFTMLTLVFNRNHLERLTIMDKLEQQTQLSLKNYDATTAIDKRQFTFIAAEGTDVLRDQ